MHLEDELEKPHDEESELVGGPYDGEFRVTSGWWIVSWEFHVYRRTSRMSDRGVNVFCYDYAGYLFSDPELEQQYRKQWED